MRVTLELAPIKSKSAATASIFQSPNIPQSLSILFLGGHRIITNWVQCQLQEFDARQNEKKNTQHGDKIPSTLVTTYVNVNTMEKNIKVFAYTDSCKPDRWVLCPFSELVEKRFRSELKKSIFPQFGLLICTPDVYFRTHLEHGKSVQQPVKKH